MKYLKKALLIVFCCTMAVAVSGTFAQAKSKNKGKIGYYMQWSYNKKSKTLTISQKHKGSTKVSAAPLEHSGRVKWPTGTRKSLPKFKKIVFKKGITKVDRLFFDIEGVTSISLPSTLKEIDYYSFSSPNGSYDSWSSTLKKITVSNKNKKFKSSDGILYTKSGKTLLLYPNGKKVAFFSTPKKVTTIGTYALRGSNVQQVTLSSNVTKIKKYAFENSLVKEINFPKKLKFIGDRSFEYAPLTQAVFGENLKYIGSHAFADCKLQSVSLPYSLETVKSSAFSSNTTLTSITLNNTCELDTSIFDNCSKYWEVAGEYTSIRQHPITVHLGAKATLPLNALIFDLGDYITFTIDSGNTTYYVQNGLLYKTRGNVKVYPQK